MHDEGGHAVERIELARHRQGIERFAVRQVAGGLAAGNFQHVEDFPVQADVRAGPRQCDKGEQLAMQHQWHQQPHIGQRQQRGRQAQAAVLARVVPAIGHVDHPLPCLQELAQGAKRRLAPRARRPIPAGRRGELSLFAQYPQRAGAAFHELRHGLYRALAQGWPVFRQRARKSQPFLAVIENGIVKMFIDIHLELGAQAAGKQHARQQQGRAAKVSHLHQ
ncbi:hypothetical protein D3C72_1084740 [compost metagenome]